jgi:hypothetical protein
MRLRTLLLLLSLCASGARAESLAPAHDATAGCVAASVQVLSEAGDRSLYRIEFVNRCNAPRNLYWCVDNAAATVPAQLVCARGRGFTLEPLHALVHRKQFQWHLPRGSRIRYHSCAGLDLPTAEFGCTTP